MAGGDAQGAVAWLASVDAAEEEATTLTGVGGLALGPAAALPLRWCEEGAVAMTALFVSHACWPAASPPFASHGTFGRELPSANAAIAAAAAAAAAQVAAHTAAHGRASSAAPIAANAADTIPQAGSSVEAAAAAAAAAPAAIAPVSPGR